MNTSDLRHLQKQLKEERKKVTLFRAPLTCTKILFRHVIPQYIKDLINFSLDYKNTLLSVFILIISIVLAYYIPGPQQQFVHQSWDYVVLATWWTILGILSSVGLGTGLHTFMLYLGPHIAKTTLAATECNTLDFSTYGLNAFACPENPISIGVTFLGIIQKVYFECFFWGAGTAIGELPPYFVAKAARLSGKKLEETLEELGDGGDDEEEGNDTNPSIMDRVKKLVIGSIGSFGFFRIMLFASIPNPLFDLAGLTCGHLLVPFWTFFGATLIGKAVNKTLIQSIFVLTAFSKDHLEVLIDYIESKLPFLEGILRTFFERQRAQFHLHGPKKPTEPQSWLSLSGLWDIFLMGMISYFLISILESAVQHHLATVDDFKIKTMMNNQPKKKQWK